MSDARPPEIPDEIRASVLARFEEHRRAWHENSALRRLYQGWYGRIRDLLPPRELGPWLELGSGPGFAREHIPEMELSDVVQAPWHDRCISAEALPFDEGTVGALVLFDVLHHLSAPGRFFVEAERVLRPGGRVVMCEPYISPVSGLVYRLFHSEPVDMSARPLAQARRLEKDPFDSNQAIPTLLCRPEGQRELRALCPGLRLMHFERLAGLSYPTSGGFSHGPFVPMPVWQLLLRIEGRLPKAAYRVLGFRMIAVFERS